MSGRSRNHARPNPFVRRMVDARARWEQGDHEALGEFVAAYAGLRTFYPGCLTPKESTKWPALLAECREAGLPIEESPWLPVVKPEPIDTPQKLLDRLDLLEVERVMWQAAGIAPERFEAHAVKVLDVVIDGGMAILAPTGNLAHDIRVLRWWARQRLAATSSEVTTRDAANNRPPSKKPLTEAQRKVYDMIVRDGPLQGKQIAKALGIGESTVTSRYISALKDHGILSCRGLGYYHPSHYRPD